MYRALGVPTLMAMRLCRKQGCATEASATCSFNYALGHVWIGPLAFDPEPGTYDLCDEHAARFVAPRGWVLSDLRAEAQSA